MRGKTMSSVMNIMKFTCPWFIPMRISVSLGVYAWEFRSDIWAGENDLAVISWYLEAQE